MNALTFAELEVGRSARFSHHFEERDLDAFAGLSGDTSPIHMSAQGAGAAGFGARVVHGLLTASLLSRLVGVELPGATALLHRADIQFVSPVFPGDELQITGSVIGRVEAYRQVEIKAKIENQHGLLVVRAKLWVGVSG